jgi:hypothetical protein
MTDQTLRALAARGKASQEQAGTGRSGSHVVVRCLFGAQPERRARRIVAGELAGAQVGAELADVELAVDEMVSNARLHAPGPYELRVIFGWSGVRVAVVDSGADHAELDRKLRRAAAGGASEGESGRGLQIITGLFPGAWGTGPTLTCAERRPAKQVWITLPADPASRPGR